VGIIQLKANLLYFSKFTYFKLSTLTTLWFSVREKSAAPPPPPHFSGPKGGEEDEPEAGLFFPPSVLAFYVLEMDRGGLRDAY
jgi:hypothetical protein